jgi:hypothetical protein
VPQLGKRGASKFAAATPGLAQAVSSVAAGCNRSAINHPQQPQHIIKPKCSQPIASGMVQLPRMRRAIWPVGAILFVPLCWLGVLGTQTTGPVCAVVAEEAAKPVLGLLEGPPPPTPACIRVELNPAR